MPVQTFTCSSTDTSGCAVGTLNRNFARVEAATAQAMLNTPSTYSKLVACNTYNCNTVRTLGAVGVLGGRAAAHALHPPPQVAAANACISLASNADSYVMSSYGNAQCSGAAAQTIASTCMLVGSPATGSQSLTCTAGSTTAYSTNTFTSLDCTGCVCGGVATESASLAVT